MLLIFVLGITHVSYASVDQCAKERPNQSKSFDTNLILSYVFPKKNSFYGFINQLGKLDVYNIRLILFAELQELLNKNIEITIFVIF